MADIPIKTSFDEDDGLQKSRELAKELEAKTDTAADVEVRQLHRSRVAKKPSTSVIKRQTPSIKKVRLRRGVMASVGFGGLIVIGAIVLFSPTLLLVNMKEQLTNDLNDSALAYYTYARKVLASQIGGNCAADTIQCKFKTMSPMLKERFEERGFRIQGAPMPSERTAVSMITAPDGKSVAVNSAGFMNLMQSRGAAADRIFDTVDPKNALFHDRKFAERLFQRFRLSQSFNLSGSNTQEIIESFDYNLWSDDDTIDAYGNGVYGLDYLSQTEDIWRDTIYPEIVNKASTHLGIACGIHTYANVYEGSVRKAKMTSLARFAMIYLTAADTIKSDRGRPDKEIEFLSERLTIADSDARSGTDGSSFRVPAMYEKPRPGQLPNGRTFMNDPKQLLRLVSTPLNLIEHLRNASKGVGNVPSGYKACSQGLSEEQRAKEQDGGCKDPGIVSLLSYLGAGQAGSFIAPYIGEALPPAAQAALAAACRLAYSQVVDGSKAVIQPLVSPLLPATLQIALNQEKAKLNWQTSGVAAQDAIFAGTGILLGDVAQSIGMRPASKTSLKNYIIATQTEYKELVDRERIAARATPWDITNQYSFLGTVVRQVGLLDVARASSLSTGFLEVLIKTPAQMATRLVPPAAHAIYSHPINMNMDRFLSAADCSIPGKLDINPDFGCNIRYSMSKADLNKNIDAVLEYMTTPQPRGADDGTPTNNMGMDKEVSDRVQKEYSEGSTSFIDPASGAPNQYTPYARFLQYCTNREQPWGIIGMHTEYSPADYTPDGKNYRGVREYSSKDYMVEKIDEFGNPIETDEELPWGYYGMAWGNQADQKWMSGEKCLEDSEMLQNFRAYTVMCRALAGMSGARECWHDDAMPSFKSGWHARNNILFIQDS